LLVHEFERQGEYLQPALMPMLSLCRTAIDVDMTDGLRENLVDSVYTFLPTDTLLFCGEQMAGFQERYDQLTPSLINRFCGHFKMEMQPVYSQDLIPPAFPGPSESFNKFVENCDNWKLIGLETIAIWLKSTISASLIIENL
jgi:ATP synthase F1 complex assembly factor 2